MAQRSSGGWRAGGAAGAAGSVRWWGLKSPQRGQSVRRCAAPGQNRWSGLQGRAVCGSCWRTKRGQAGAGGWWYLWTDSGVGVWGLAVRACWRVCVRRLWCWVDGLGPRGGGSCVRWYVPGWGLLVGRTGV